MAILAAPVTVATTATRLDSIAESQPVSQCMVRNRGTATVFVGDSTVTTATGFPVDAGETLVADLSRADGLYGIVAAATQPVRVIEVGAS